MYLKVAISRKFLSIVTRLSSAQLPWIAGSLLATHTPVTLSPLVQRMNPSILDSSTESANLSFTSKFRKESAADATKRDASIFCVVFLCLEGFASKVDQSKIPSSRIKDPTMVAWNPNALEI